MKIIATYVAFDGTRFDDEFDCMDYEFTSQMKDCKIRAYDNKRHRVNNWYDIDGYSNVHRIIVSDEKDLDDIRRVCEYAGIYNEVNSIGTWVYDEDEDNWILRPSKQTNKA